MDDENKPSREEMLDELIKLRRKVEELEQELYTVRSPMEHPYYCRCSSCI